MSTLAALVDGVIGVDSHRDTLAAAALSPVGGLLGQTAATRGHVPGRRCWAIEGAGSYGAGLAAFLGANGEQFRQDQGDLWGRWQERYPTEP
jgi:transposase